MTHCIAAGSRKFPNSESFISQNIWFDICVHENVAGWADCRRHRSDLGLPGGGHGAGRGEADLWQLVVYGLPVIVQGRGLPIHNTHHILFLGSDNKLIDCFASVSTWKMMPAVPTSTATVKIQRKSLSRTWATYFQSSIIWTKTGCIVRGELSIMSSFSLFKKLQGLFVLRHYSLHLLSSFPLGIFLFLLWTKFHRGLCRSPDKDDPAYNELGAVIEYGFIMKYWHRTTNTYLLHFCVDAVLRISMNFTASIEIITGPTVNPLNNGISLKF